MTVMLFFSLAVAFLVSVALCFLLWKAPLPSSLLDTDTASVQKIHLSATTPRIGGLVLYASLVVGACFYPSLRLPVLIALPALLAGLLEDTTKRLGPLLRLILSFIAAALACWYLDAGFYHSGWGTLDVLLLASPLFAYPIAIFMVGGVMHAINIIDGYNGLMLGNSIIVASALLYAAGQVGDSSLVLLLVFLLLGLFALLLFNFPWGRIFAGDGGSYLVGFVFAVASLLLVDRHTEISPWFPLMLLAYPIWETLFSIYRRLFVYGVSPGDPDNLHIHSLVHRILARKLPRQSPLLHNALVAPCMWVFALLGVIPALLFWQNTPALLGAALGFIVIYQFLYRTLFRLAGVYNAS